MLLLLIFTLHMRWLPEFFCQFDCFSFWRVFAEFTSCSSFLEYLEFIFPKLETYLKLEPGQNCNDFLLVENKHIRYKFTDCNLPWLHDLIFSLSWHFVLILRFHRLKNSCFWTPEFPQSFFFSICHSLSWDWGIKGSKVW